MIIVTGTVLQHTHDSEWFARVLEIREDANEAEMYISREQGGDGWIETWNLAHTRAGLDQGEYKVIGKCTDENI